MKLASLPLWPRHALKLDFNVCTLASYHGISTLLNWSWAPQFGQCCLTQTTIRQEAAFNDPTIPTAIQYVQDKVEHPVTSLEKRMTYLRLSQVFSKLQQLVALGRQNGDIILRQGQRNHCLVVDLCLECLPTVSRYQIFKYRRIAKRWSLLAGSSAIILALYPKSIDYFV